MTEKIKIYSKKILLDRLQELKLPCTYPSLLRYERNGLIKKPVNMIVFNDRSWRMYTNKEINEIIEILKKHVKKL